MMDFNERVIPGVSANFLYKEAFARYEFAERVLRQRKRGRLRVLDLACGTGYGSALLSKSHTVIGIDRDEEAVAFAKKCFGDRVYYLTGNVEKGLQRQIPDQIRHDVFFDDSPLFDCICAFEIIEHLNKPHNFLKNAFQLLKPNGIMILSTPNAEIPTPPNSTRSKYHTKEFTYKEFNMQLKKTFKNVQMYGQKKDIKAQEAFQEFLKSQSVRQQLVNSDRFGFRKRIPQPFKEFIWKYAGAFFGRKPQDELTTDNFPVTKKDVADAEYFIAICRK